MGFKVAQSNPAAGTPADLYTVPSDKQAVISSLTVCNYGTVTAKYDLLVRPAGAAAADVHFLAAGAALAAPVQSVNGASGTVVLDTGDISEDGNLYFTADRARAAVLDPFFLMGA